MALFTPSRYWASSISYVYACLLQAFQVAVDGTDDHANPLRRVHTSLINTVAIKVQDLPIQSKLTTSRMV